MAEHWPCMYKAVGLVPSTSKHLVNSMKALVSIVSYQDTEPGRTKVLSLPAPRFFGKQEDSTSLKLPRVQSKRPRSWDALPSSHKSASTSQQAPLGSQGFSGTSFFFFLTLVAFQNLPTLPTHCHMPLMKSVPAHTSSRIQEAVEGCPSIHLQMSTFKIGLQVSQELEAAIGFLPMPTTLLETPCGFGLMSHSDFPCLMCVADLGWSSHRPCFGGTNTLSA